MFITHIKQNRLEAISSKNRHGCESWSLELAGERLKAME